MKQTPKEKAKELFNYHHKLITNVGFKSPRKILVTILAEQCALFFAKQMQQEMWDIKKFKEHDYWNEVEIEINNHWRNEE